VLHSGSDVLVGFFWLVILKPTFGKIELHWVGS
jgi:hypothetical protein